MEQYFWVALIPKMKYITIVSMYLEGDTKLWWWSRLQEDVKVQQLTIETWETLKR